MSKDWRVKAPVAGVEPAEQYVIKINQTAYLVDWNALIRGASFIIPTVASASTVAGALSPAAAFFEYELLCEEILWYDMTAVRVHRTH